MKRKPEHLILPEILNRWYSRAMNGESISDEELMTLFDAARWAPSSYNGQPWRFIYVKREDPEWEQFLDLLIDFNKNWAKNAGAIICTISRKTFTHNDKPCKTHSFDTGAAWMGLAIQGVSMNLVVHGMEGFSYKRAREILEIPDEYEVEMMIAVGRPGLKESLPEDMQKMEKMSDRNPINSFAMKGKYKKSGT
ncbi:MAG: nitroreductase family protein [Candidatus Algichlamydia australiensis]|nr:nitroreductase family protein [Chlamydiales bacterium]